MRNELLLKLFLGGNGPLEATVRHLEEARDHFQELSGTYDRIARELDSIQDPDLEDVLGRITLDFGVHRVRAGAEWAEAALAKVRGLDDE